jgi:hypothetical protein
LDENLSEKRQGIILLNSYKLTRGSLWQKKGSIP